MKILVDSHTHTLLSVHAYGTVRENMLFGKEAGMQAVAITDHYSSVLYDEAELRRISSSMRNMAACPDLCEGVRLLRGIEVDICDDEGRLFGYNIPVEPWETATTEEKLIGTRDVVIASLHDLRYVDMGDVPTNTRRYVGAVRNPHVHILGHCARPGARFDIDEVLRAAKDAGTLIEINEHSFRIPGAPESCRKVAERCAELGVMIAVGSDAHSCYHVGTFTRVLAMLEEIGFPEELVANRTLDIFMQAIGKKG